MAQAERELAELLKAIESGNQAAIEAARARYFAVQEAF